ncbi:hypothetical protein FB567DRAFT_632464 [Paraphoma chrysanthemicola]|uniref:Monooxygenase n=1 Tax=Paraphoma chrysanthemicola TaxID=798071 RepID=A0A8K0QXM5_9PLEO|nr:hypothetical protein FB567DRAFT_632464 [Paraphoma chrysanthemicola]
MSTVLDIFSAFLPTDYTVSTWLLLGATIQSLLVALLPLKVALLPPVMLLTFRFIRGFLIANGTLPNHIAKEVTHGRQTWQIPSEDKTLATKGSTESVVVLVLAASWTHPNGKFSPGSEQMNKYFAAMWQDAAENRDLYGFLGNTPGLSTVDDGTRQDAKGMTTIFLSYWKTIEGLHKFAHGKTHMKGQLWWERSAMEEFPHIGVAHETYEVPAGNWENVYHNFRPFGLANAQYPVRAKSEESLEGEEQTTSQWVSGLRHANGKDWKSMYSRMGRKAPFSVVKSS